MSVVKLWWVVPVVVIFCVDGVVCDDGNDTGCTIISGGCDGENSVASGGDDCSVGGNVNGTGENTVGSIGVGSDTQSHGSGSIDAIFVVIFVVVVMMVVTFDVAVKSLSSFPLLSLFIFS